jgi:hypothetical protein
MLVKVEHLTLDATFFLRTASVNTAYRAPITIHPYSSCEDKNGLAQALGASKQDKTFSVRPKQIPSHNSDRRINK